MRSHVNGDEQGCCLKPKVAAAREFCPDTARDIFLVTYPRSGTTWISCVAAELLFQTSPKSLTEIGWFVPDMHHLPEKSVVPPAEAGNWTQLQSREDLKAISILEDFARDAMRRSGYECSADAKGQLSAAE